MTVIICSGEFRFVYRDPTEKDKWRYLTNGYSCPTLEREEREEVYRYARGQDAPRFPVPARREAPAKEG